jgi:hypothetical protein
MRARRAQVLPDAAAAQPNRVPPEGYRLEGPGLAAPEAQAVSYLRQGTSTQVLRGGVPLSVCDDSDAPGDDCDCT